MYMYCSYIHIHMYTCILQVGVYILVSELNTQYSMETYSYTYIVIVIAWQSKM